MKTLPLGIDIGATRVRLALAVRESGGKAKVAAVATREVDLREPFADIDLTAAILEDLRREIGTKERRCTLALSHEEAVVRYVRFPRMSSSERARAARFEATRFVPWKADENRSIVRVRSIEGEEGRAAVGVAKLDEVTRRQRCIKRSGLRLAALDSDALALSRAFPWVDAVIDIGCARTTVHAITVTGPISVALVAGGSSVTHAIAADLDVTEELAEKRKRILGTAGAGERAREELIESIAGALDSIRDRKAVRRVALTGNGARLPGLQSSTEERCNVLADLCVSPILTDAAYPEDVVRSAAPDWTLAAALATWSAAEW